MNSAQLSAERDAKDAVSGNFSEIIRILAELPSGDMGSGTACLARLAEIYRGQNLSALASQAHWLATWQGSALPHVKQPRIALFAGNHGVATQIDGEQGGAAVLVGHIIGGNAVINRLAEAQDCDLRLYEMNLAAPVADFTREPAMSEAECVRAIAYGMMAVEPGIDVLALGGFGDGYVAAAEALLVALGFAQSESAIVGAGVKLHEIYRDQPLELLRRLGGVEMAAMLGAMMAARMAQVPVVVSDEGALAATAVLHALDRRAVAHCLVAVEGDGLRAVAENLGLMFMVTPPTGGQAGAAAVAALAGLRNVIALGGEQVAAPKKCDGGCG